MGSLSLWGRRICGGLLLLFGMGLIVFSIYKSTSSPFVTKVKEEKLISPEADGASTTSTIINSTAKETSFTTTTTRSHELPTSLLILMGLIWGILFFPQLKSLSVGPVSFEVRDEPSLPPLEPAVSFSPSNVTGPDNMSNS